MEQEKWEQVEGFERYLISTRGRIISTVSRPKELKIQTDKLGYKFIRMYPVDARFGYYPNDRGMIPKLEKIHRLVLQTFNPTKDKSLQVNHLNGDKSDNRLDNLEWVTHSYNIQHSWDIGLRDNHMVERGAVKRRRPVVAIHKDGSRRYFASRMHLYFNMKCSRAAISIYLRADDFISRGPAKGYTFQGIDKLPEGEKFEWVEDYKGKIKVYNERFYYNNLRRKKLDN